MSPNLGNHILAPKRNGDTKIILLAVNLIFFFTRRLKQVTIDLKKSVCTWRHGDRVGVPKQRSGGHFGVPNEPLGN